MILDRTTTASLRLANPQNQLRFGTVNHPTDSHFRWNTSWGPVTLASDESGDPCDRREHNSLNMVGMVAQTQCVLLRCRNHHTDDVTDNHHQNPDIELHA